MPGNVHHATFDAALPLTADTLEYRFQLAQEEAALAWRAGQFVSLQVGTQPDGTASLRSYSIASRPGGAGFSLVVKHIAGGAGSEWLAALVPGTRVRFTGPMGFFVLELAHPGDAVFGATGTGVAPIVPMIEELLERGERGRILLRWGVRHEADLFWRPEIDALVERAAGRLDARILVSRPDAGWHGPVGRISPLIFEALPSLSRPTFYLCGNGAMIRDVKAGLVERGVDRKRQIRVEAFFD